MNRVRPVNLNLFTIRFPLPAIVSILHRISGVFLFLSIPVILWALDFSLTQDGFDALHDWSGNILIKFVIWAVLAAFLYHLVAGIRHLLTDVQIGTSRESGKRTALMVFVISIIFIILAGIWLW